MTSPFVLDGVEGGDADQHVSGDRRCIGKLAEFAAHVCQAEREADLALPPGESGAVTISIDLLDTRKIAEMRFCPLAS